MAAAVVSGDRWSRAGQRRSWSAAPKVSRRTVERLGGIALAALLHVAVIWALLQLEAVRSSIIQAAPIMVRFITPPQVEEQAKPIDAPKPIEPPKRVEQPKPITRPVPPPRKAVAPPPEPAMQASELSAPISAAEPQEVSEPRPVEAPVTPSAPLAPAAVIPPSFNAAYLHNPKPAYPALSRRDQEQGIVRLRVYVTAGGNAEKVEIEASSGWPRLDDAAQQTVRSWRFVPAKQGDRAVSAWVIVPIKFALEG